ncbi:TPA: hypothetical protein MFS62_005225 [Klebsiella pneumoniae]|nr:hypothetical protein [Klebsiella pneumoniae]
MGVARISFAGRALTDFPPIFIAKNYAENAKPENRRAGPFFVGFLTNSHKNRKNFGLKNGKPVCGFLRFFVHLFAISGKIGEAWGGGSPSVI